MMNKQEVLRCAPAKQGAYGAEMCVGNDPGAVVEMSLGAERYVMHVYKCVEDDSPDLGPVVFRPACVTVDDVKALAFATWKSAEMRDAVSEMVTKGGLN